MKRTVAAGAILALAALSLAACSSTDETTRSDVGVQLFQMPWTAIADECESTLGPAGYGWVLTSPPQESITGDEWWVSYQPVSYQLDSRLGTRDEFADMVKRCDAVGVGIIADAVINHMSGQSAPGTGFAGSAYEHHSYPGLYEPADFHDCGLTGDNDIRNYRDRAQVQTCELVNLADLDTSAPRVRATIVAYLNDLLSLGVAGFRIDAAKHIAATDVEAIVAELPANTTIMSEVIRGSGEPVLPEEYLGAGSVFEFTYARDLGIQFVSGSFTEPDLSNERPQHVPSDQAIVFVDNHDTERGEAQITYRDGDAYAMANVLMLADDYGTPVVYSGYAFSDRDAGAKTTASGTIEPVGCAEGAHGPQDFADGDRTCIHVWDAIAPMVAFRIAVGEAPRLPGVMVDDAYAFEREGRGAVAVNQGESEATLTLPTTMPDATYCDVLVPECAVTVTVDNGTATFTLAAGQSSAIHVEAVAR